MPYQWIVIILIGLFLATVSLEVLERRKFIKPPPLTPNLIEEEERESFILQKKKAPSSVKRQRHSKKIVLPEPLILESAGLLNKKAAPSIGRQKNHSPVVTSSQPPADRPSLPRALMPPCTLRRRNDPLPDDDLEKSLKESLSISVESVGERASEQGADLRMSTASSLKETSEGPLSESLEDQGCLFSALVSVDSEEVSAEGSIVSPPLFRLQDMKTVISEMEGAESPLSHSFLVQDSDEEREEALLFQSPKKSKGRIKFMSPRKLKRILQEPLLKSETVEVDESFLRSSSQGLSGIVSHSEKENINDE